MARVRYVYWNTFNSMINATSYSFKDIKVNYKVKNNVQAPITKGQEIGTLEIISNNEIVLTSNLIALQEVEAKGFFGRLWSRFVLWIMSLFGIA